MFHFFVRPVMFAGAALLFAFFANAEVPQMINYQGRLTDSTGSPLPDTDYSITFGIYASELGDTALWVEGQLVGTQDGLFSVMLGSVVPIPSVVFSEPNRWLQITVELEGILPRSRFVTVPYAYRALWADTASVALSGTGIGGSGSTNYIAKFTGATTIGNSVIYESGGKLGIGTTPDPDYKLYIYRDANNFAKFVKDGYGVVGRGAWSGIYGTGNQGVYGYSAWGYGE